ncbi:hypothetical protein ACEPAG_4655 [Sanghuangporus baumii]
MSDFRSRGYESSSDLPISAFIVDMIALLAISTFLIGSVDASYRTGLVTSDTLSVLRMLDTLVMIKFPDPDRVSGKAIVEPRKVESSASITFRLVVALYVSTVFAMLIKSFLTLVKLCIFILALTLTIHAIVSNTYTWSQLISSARRISPQLFQDMQQNHSLSGVEDRDNNNHLEAYPIADPCNTGHLTDEDTLQNFLGRSDNISDNDGKPDTAHRIDVGHPAPDSSMNPTDSQGHSVENSLIEGDNKKDIKRHCDELTGAHKPLNKSSFDQSFSHDPISEARFKETHDEEHGTRSSSSEQSQEKNTQSTPDTQAIEDNEPGNFDKVNTKLLEGDKETSRQAANKPMDELAAKSLEEKKATAHKVIRDTIASPVPPANVPFYPNVEVGERLISPEQTRRVVLDALMMYVSEDNVR